MNKKLAEIENRFQEVMLRIHSVEELFEIDEEYFSYLEKQLERDPKNVHVLMHLGVLSWEPFHKQEDAIKYLEKAIEYDPKQVEARFWLAKCYYHDFCLYEKTQQILLDALRINPHRADCLDLLASVVEDMSGNFEQAIQYCEQAVHYAPNWPMLRASLARLYLEMKDYKSAIFQIEEAFRHFSPLLKPPKNSIEDYYENIVTGRGWTDLQKEFKDIILRIETMKTQTNL